MNVAGGDAPLASVPAWYRWRYGYRWSDLLFSGFLVLAMAGLGPDQDDGGGDHSERNDTVAPEALDPAVDDPDDYSPPPILCGLVEDTLMSRGWRLEHPALRGLLIGPEGQRIDVIRSVTLAEAGYDLEPLRDLLRRG